MEQFKMIKDKGLLLYRYVRGSKLYGLDCETSDTDYGAVYIEPLSSLLGFNNFPENVNNETNDETWNSLGKYGRLLLQSNPNILESLFVPPSLIDQIHPAFEKWILKEKDKFISKACFGSFMGYAKTQIEKARSLKKKITMPMEGPLLPPLDFVMYSEEGQSRKVRDWLESRSMKQEFCGLVNLDKMPCQYSMYYDWGRHFEGMTLPGFINLLGTETAFIRAFKEYVVSLGLSFDTWPEKQQLYERYKNAYKYHGLVGNDSREIRLSSIPKEEKPVLSVSYNQDGYSGYCRQWKEYNDFKKHHNPERFNLAKEKQYDRKNMMHAFRLLGMGIEIAKGEGFLVDRREIDREFLLNVRKGELEYDELLGKLKEKDEEMKEAMLGSKIQERVDPDFLESRLIGLRREIYGI